MRRLASYYTKRSSKNLLKDLIKKYKGMMVSKTITQLVGLQFERFFTPIIVQHEPYIFPANFKRNTAIKYSISNFLAQGFETPPILKKVFEAKGDEKNEEFSTKDKAQSKQPRSSLRKKKDVDDVMNERETNGKHQETEGEKGTRNNQENKAVNKRIKKNANEKSGKKVEEKQKNDEEEGEAEAKDLRKSRSISARTSKKMDSYSKSDVSDVKPTPKRATTENFEIGDGKIPKDEIRISSWNINGLRAVLRKGELQNYLKSNDIDIICFNETRIDSERLNVPEVTDVFPLEYYLYFNCCKTSKGYSGTGIATKYKPISIQMDLNNPKHDNEGRTITLEFETFYLVSCYVPNSGRNLDRLPYRTQEWDPDFRNFLVNLKSRKNVICGGDLNVAHKEIDIYDAKGNKNKTAGFTDAERQELTNLLAEGFVDSFRELYPTKVKYSWWSAKFNNRATNKGWRIDYFVVDREGMMKVKESIIKNDVLGSDHCPIELVYYPNK